MKKEIIALVAALILVGSSVSALTIQDIARGLSIPASIVPTGQIIYPYPGSSFNYNFSLTQSSPSAIPLTSATLDVHLYKTYWIVDSNGVQVASVTVELGRDANNNIIATYPQGTVISIPVTFAVTGSIVSGQYAASATLWSLNQTWNPSTNVWVVGSAVVIAQQGVAFQVQTPVAAPLIPTGTITAALQGLWNAIWCAISHLWGGTC